MTTFSDLVKEGLSFLHLFLEFLETVWSLQKLVYIKKHYKTKVDSAFVKANLAFGLIYEAKSQVGLDERGLALGNFLEIAIDISSLEIHFGCAFSISDTVRAIFFDYV